MRNLIRSWGRGRRRPAAESPARSRATGRDTPPPRLSVVLPVYNVAEYLEACLQSILGQDVDGLELIVVDDGSTDSSPQILRRVADRDDRVTVITTENQGLGAARNTGMRHMTGTYVAFADSDDVVLPGGYPAMLKALETSGSDFVSGMYRRGDEEQGPVPIWMRRTHASKRIGVTLDEHSEMLFDITVWNKVFRRDFLDRIGLEFPERVSYEDQAIITKAYLLAERFDVIPKKVYLWRVREDGSSITQQRLDSESLRHRFDALAQCRDLTVELGSPAVRLEWQRKLVDWDVPVYFSSLLDADDDFWAEFLDLVADLGQGIDEEAYLRSRIRHRIYSWLLVHQQREAFVTLMRSEEAALDEIPRQWHGSAGRFVLPDSVAAVVPPRLNRITGTDAYPVGRLTAVEYDGDDLMLTGFAFLRGVDSRTGLVETTVRLVDDGAGTTLTLPNQPYDEPAANLAARSACEDHTRSGFRARVPLADLVVAERAVVRWRLEIEHRFDGVDHVRGVDGVEAAGSPGYGGPVLVDDAFVQQIRASTGAVVRVRRGHATVISLDHTPTGMSIQLRPGPIPMTRLSVLTDSGEQVEIPFHLGVDGTVITEPSLVDGVLRAGFATGPAFPVNLPPGVDVIESPDRSRRLRVVKDSGVGVRMTTAPVLVIEGVAPDAGHDLRVRGVLHGPTAARIALVDDSSGRRSAPREVGPGPFEIGFDLTTDEFGLGRRTLPEGQYEIAVVDGSGTEVMPSGRLWQAPRLRVEARGHHWVVNCHDHGVGLTATALPDAERSAFARFEAMERGRVRGRSGLRDAVVLESFGGAFMGDSPLAVGQALLRRGVDVELLCSVKDRSVWVPEGFRPLVVGSEQWWDAVGTARWLVNNNNFPREFVKVPGQVYVQTWHGTPLKRIAHDVVDPALLNGPYMRQMDREAAAWDFLVSPNPFSSGVLPGAFGYRGALLETGYPRNDVLVGADVAARGALVRERLGVAPEARVVLYAPTWRDKARAGGRPVRMLFFDPVALANEVPDAVVLVRGHANTVGRGDGTELGHPRVVDVTDYPSVSDLLLVADELITDYSSIMFDYAVLDRPIHLLVPDLATYRDQERGFYFDIEELPPGGIYANQAELFDAIVAGPPDTTAVRAAFRKEFTVWDDGGATDRLIDAVFDL